MVPRLWEAPPESRVRSTGFARFPLRALHKRIAPIRVRVYLSPLQKRCCDAVDRMKFTTRSLVFVTW